MHFPDMTGRVRRNNRLRDGLAALLLLSFATVTPAALKLERGLATPYAAPEFAGIGAWLNSPPLTLQQLKGKVVLVDFWTYSCINCVRTLPHITAWDRKYREQGLVIVGVHSPEFEFEKKLDNVKAAIAKHGIRYPVAIDNAFATWDRYHNRFWPAHYLIDREGQVVYTHYGEGRYDVMENNIRYLLGMKEPIAAGAHEVPAYSDAQTPETYLGYQRADRFASKESLQQDRQATYRFPDALAADNWALNGKWKVEGERIVSSESGAALRLHFRARKVFLVLGARDNKPRRASLALNGKPAGAIIINGTTLYELIDQREAKAGLLEIRAEGPGLEAYAFTFGS